jgi:surfeit locus 1 family protein
MPPWWATLATLAGLGVFVSLGLWQLDRAAEKRTLLQLAAEEGPAWDALPPDDTPLEAWLFRRVALSGGYEAQRQVLLDNMTLDGRVGYQVLTPFRLDSGELVLVNRGWVPAAGQRSELPAVDVADGPRVVEGRLNRLPRPGIRLGPGLPGAPDDPWPRRLLYPDHPTLVEAYREALAPYQLQLDPTAPDGFVRRWELVNMPPERHLGYAVQWFAFALVLVVIYGWLGFGRGRKSDAG